MQIISKIVFTVPSVWPLVPPVMDFPALNISLIHHIILMSLIVIFSNSWPFSVDAKSPALAVTQTVCSFPLLSICPLNDSSFLLNFHQLSSLIKKTEMGQKQKVL